MSAPLTMPTQHIYLQLADPWTTADYTDITPLVKTWSGTVRGRQHELQLFQPGQVALTLESNLNQGRFNPWNTNSVYYNLLSADDAAQVASNGTWGNASHATITAYPTTPPVTLDIGYALKINTTGTSPAQINTAQGTYAVVAGQLYSAMCSFLAGTTGRACSVGIQWYNSSAALISTTTSTTVNDNTSTWTKASLLGAKAPVGAVWAAVVISITTSAVEVHWACRAALFNYSGNCPNTAWGPGQRGLVPGRPIYCTATWNSTTYNVWSMYTSNFTPAYGQVKSEQVINCSDGLALLALGDISSSAYATQVLTDGAQNFWRLGDAVNSSQALDSGPLNTTLQAYFTSFGQASPMYTDDTTTAGFSSTNNGVLTGTSSVATGVQTLEMLISLPSVSTYEQIFNGGAANSFISYDAPTSTLYVSGDSTGSGTLASVGIVNTTINNGSWHHLVVTCSAATNGTMTVYLDGVSIGSATASGGGGSCFFTGSSGGLFYIGSQPGYQFTGTMADVAVYTSALTPTQIANHYNLFSTGWTVQYSGQRIAAILTVVGWPSTLQNVATGISQVQAATSTLTQTAALSYMQTIESTEMGALFVDGSGNLTFYDRHYIITNSLATTSNGTFTSNPAATGTYYRYLPGLVPAMDDTDLWNDIPAQRNGGVLQRTLNALSVSQYRKRTLTGYTGQLQTSDAEVLAQSQWLCQLYKTPYTRCRSISLSSVTDAGKNLPQMLGRGIFDQITLIWNPIDGSTVYFNQPSLIESIQHTVTQETWITTWGLSPAEVQSTYMILNNATQGQLSENNRLAY